VNYAETGGLEAVQGKRAQDNPISRDKGAQGFNDTNFISRFVF
jgi:hypothetical protein